MYRTINIFLFIAAMLLGVDATAQSRIITTIAGQAPIGVSGTVTGDSCGSIGVGGLAAHSLINGARFVCTDTAGNIYFSGPGTGLKRIDATTGILSLLAGGGTDWSGIDTIPATAMGLDIFGACMDTGGYLLFCYANTQVVRLNLSTGYFTVVAGVFGLGDLSGDGGPATAAGIRPYNIGFDRHHNLYIADRHHAVVRRVDASTGIITRVAGDGFSSFAGDGGSATSARLFYPSCVVLDTNNNVYIADFENYRVRKVDAITGSITTIAGNGSVTFDISDSIPATAVNLGRPHTLTFDDTGYLYIGCSFVPSNYTKIWKMNLSNGIIRSYAFGSMNLYGPGYPGDGLDPDSAYAFPHSITFDSSNNMYIAENCRIRKITITPGEGGGGGDTTGGQDTTNAVNHHTGSSIRLYPNPTHQQLHLSGISHPMPYRLIAITGATQAQGTLLPTATTVDMAAYPPGIYILELHSPQGTVIRYRVQRE
jgi:hypothetical protein